MFIYNLTGVNICFSSVNVWILAWKIKIYLQTSTSAGWDGFMEPTLYVDGHHECKIGDENGFGRTCNNSSWFGYFYFIRLAYNA